VPFEILAAQELGLETAPYRYATSFETLKSGTEAVGMPCVVKPLMSSSGKGQSVIRTEADIEKAWQYALEGSRGDLAEVIVESFIDFDYEITLLTLTQDNGETLFCPPIGHRQERGDYQESWQPAAMESSELAQAQEMAAAVTASLGGNGIWGVEFFIKRRLRMNPATVYFSELSPRPHDTGMVTLGHTQNFSEFELHARAILGLPVHAIEHLRNGASAVVLAPSELWHRWKGKRRCPNFQAFEEAAAVAGTDIRLFGKPTIRPYRRMAVALSFDQKERDVMELVKAKEVAALIRVGAEEIERLKREVIEVFFDPSVEVVIAKIIVAGRSIASLIFG
jgi:phosphoribosylglycinamide formyltransferase 2